MRGLQPAGGTRDRGLEGPRLRLRCCPAIQPPAPDRLSQDSHRPLPLTRALGRSQQVTFSCACAFLHRLPAAHVPRFSASVFSPRQSTGTRRAPSRPLPHVSLRQRRNAGFPSAPPAVLADAHRALAGACVAPPAALGPHPFVPSVCSSPLTAWRANHRVPRHDVPTRATKWARGLAACSYH